MRIELLLQIAIATLTSLGTLMLGMGEREIALPLIAIVVSASSVYLTDVSGWLRLNARVANVAGSTAVVIFVWDFLQRFGTETQLLAIANLLIYLQFVLLYQAKSISTYWLLTLLSVLQVAVAAALNFEMIFGLLLLIYFFCGLATLGTFLALSRNDPLPTAAAGQFRALALRANIRSLAPALRWHGTLEPMVGGGGPPHGAGPPLRAADGGHGHRRAGIRPGVFLFGPARRARDLAAADRRDGAAHRRRFWNTCNWASWAKSSRTLKGSCG